MIQTGLPYDLDKMGEIQNNGAIVDMSNINFPGVDSNQQQRISFIFLRNTGFDVQLDFSKCSFDEKEKFLLLYLQGDIELKHKEFVDSWILILAYALGYILTDVDCFLTEEEIQLFIKNNQSFIDVVLKVIRSVPLVVMKCFKIDGETIPIDYSGVEESDETPVGKNFFNLIASPMFLILMDTNVEEQPVFYQKIFDIEDKNLLDSINQMPMIDILYKLGTASAEEWIEMFKNPIEISDNIENESQ